MESNNSRYYRLVLELPVLQRKESIFSRGLFDGLFALIFAQFLHMQAVAIRL